MEAKELYEREFENRESVRGAVGMPLGVLGALFGLLGSMVSEFKGAEPSLAWTGFWFAATASGLTGFAAAVYLVRSYHGRTYKALPSPLGLQAYSKELLEWHLKFGVGTPAERQKAADDDFDAWLTNQYIAAADHNTTINSQKSELLFQANKYVIWFAVACLGTYGPFVFSKRFAQTSPVDVRITAPTVFEVQQMPTQAPSTSNPPPPVPPKPKGPPLREIREGVVPHSSSGSAKTP